MTELLLRSAFDFVLLPRGVSFAKGARAKKNRTRFVWIMTRLGWLGRLALCPLDLRRT